MDEQIKPVAWRAKTPHGWVVGKTQHSSYDEPLYSQQSIDALRADAERYRALREALLDDESEAWEAFTQQPEPKSAADFDAAIDAVRKGAE